MIIGKEQFHLRTDDPLRSSSVSHLQRGERLHDGPRHAADVGAPVATDLRLIPHASRDNHVWKLT